MSRTGAFLAREQRIPIVHWLDPQYPPETKGMLERLPLDSRGGTDRLPLADGTEVDFLPLETVVAAPRVRGFSSRRLRRSIRR
jgi:hypothetical protein